MQQLDILVIAGLCASLLRRMRESQYFPWVNEHTHKWLALGLAALTALGIHFTFDSAHGVLEVSGLTLATIVPALPHTIVELVRAYALQQGADRVLHGQPIVQTVDQGNLGGVVLTDSAIRPNK